MAVVEMSGKVVVLPVLLGDGIGFSSPGVARTDLEPLSSTRSATPPSSASASARSPTTPDRQREQRSFDVTDP
jgi:hypothetical protein